MVETDNKKIYLDGYIDVPLDQLEEIQRALDIHIVLTRAETGCISFDVQPCTAIKGRFWVSEIFENQSAFEFHQTRTAASPWAKLTKDIPRHYNIIEI